tara:strand:- start:71 stop:421 length:351 start_codon:yes stop_codon:yes gene_type:complete
MILIILLLLFIVFNSTRYIEGNQPEAYPSVKLLVGKVEREQAAARLKPVKTDAKITDPRKPNCECFDFNTKKKLYHNNYSVGEIRKFINILKKDAHKASKDLDFMGKQLDYIKTIV